MARTRKRITKRARALQRRMLRRGTSGWYPRVLCLHCAGFPKRRCGKACRKDHARHDRRLQAVFYNGFDQVFLPGYNREDDARMTRLFHDHFQKEA